MIAGSNVRCVSCGYTEHVSTICNNEGSLLLLLRSSHRSEVEQFYIVAVHAKKLMQVLWYGSWTLQHAYVCYTMTMHIVLIPWSVPYDC